MMDTKIMKISELVTLNSVSGGFAVTGDLTVLEITVLAATLIYTVLRILKDFICKKSKSE